MPIIWGHLDQIEEDPEGSRWVALKTILSGSRTVIRVRARVEEQTIIARGIERIDLLSLCPGESVEVSYYYGRNGFIEAETIYVRPERALARE